MLKRLVNNIKEHPVFFGLYFVFLAVMAYFVFSYHKVDSTILVNQNWTPFQDVFFKYATYFGDGWFAIVVVLGLCFWKFKYAVIAAFSFVGSAGITQFFKRVVYDDVQRPFMELWEEFYYGELHLVLPLDEMKKANSFPSGHTTSAFSIFCILALMIRKKWWGGVCLILAAVIGYSRIYLSQHFFEDVFVGSMIGTMGSLVVYSVFQETKFGNWGEKSLLNKS